MLNQFEMKMKDARGGDKGTGKLSGSGEAPYLKKVKRPGLAQQKRGGTKKTHLEIIMRQVLLVTTLEIPDRSACMIEIVRIPGATGIAPTYENT